MKDAIAKLIVAMSDGDNFVILCLSVILIYVSYAWGIAGKDLVNVGIGGLVGYLGGQTKGEWK